MKHSLQSEIARERQREGQCKGCGRMRCMCSPRRETRNPMAEPSPGPWTCEHQPGRALEGKEARIAEMQECEPYNYACVRVPQTDFVRWFDDRVEGQTERTLADGRMHAAALEMHEALHHAYQIIDNIAHPEWSQRALAIFAKVDGISPPEEAAKDAD